MQNISIDFVSTAPFPSLTHLVTILYKYPYHKKS